jgi:N-acetylmuramidase
MENQEKLTELKARLLAVIDSYKQFNKELPAELKATVNQVLGTQNPANPQSTETNKDGKTAPANPVVSASKTLSDSVGEGGKNNPADVLLVKTLLNKFKPAFNLSDANTNTKVGPTTIGVIKNFQKEKAGLANPDGLIEPNGKTWKVLSGPVTPTVTPPTSGNPAAPIDMKDAYSKIAAKYKVESAVIYAIQSVESGGNGFLKDGRSKILFEGHIFWDELVKAKKDPNKYVAGNENILYKRWTKVHYVGGAGEYTRLEKAMKIDSTAALKSASWGEFQIMGFNHASVGYSTVEAFVEAMKIAGSTNNIDALMKFLETNNLLRHVQGASKNWAALAKGYNGPAYAENQYDTKLAAAYQKFKNK